MKVINKLKSFRAALILLTLFYMPLCSDMMDIYTVQNTNTTHVVEDGSESSADVWIQSTVPPFGESWSSGIMNLVYLNGYFICSSTGTSISKIAYGTDADSDWHEALTLPFGNNFIRGIAYGNGYYVAVGNYHIARSSDLAEWYEAGSHPFGSTVIGGVIFDGSRFITYNVSGTNPYVIAYSLDGNTWTSATPTVSNQIGGIAYDGNGHYLAVTMGGSGAVYTSSDAVTWHAGTAVDLSGFPSNSLIFVNGIWITTGSKYVAGLGKVVGMLAYSSNGTDWNIPITGDDGEIPALTGVAYGEGLYIVTGSGGTILYGSNLEMLISVNDSPFGTNDIGTVCYGDGKFVAGDDSGIVAYSVE